MMALPIFTGCAIGFAQHSGVDSKSGVDNTLALAVVQSICRQHYVEVGSKGQNAVVFIEISTSREPWIGGAPSIALTDSYLKGLGGLNVRFLRDQEFDAQIGTLDKGDRVVRATFFPFAAAYQGGDTIDVPVKDGDVMKWRQCLFHLHRTQADYWQITSIEHK